MGQAEEANRGLSGLPPQTEWSHPMSQLGQSRRFCDVGVESGSSPRADAAASTLPQAAAPSVPRQGEPQPQATAQPQAEQLSSVPRPPMPLLAPAPSPRSP